MIIKYKKLRKDSKVPTSSHGGDAGRDLTVTSVESSSLFKVVYGFGLSFEMPENSYAMITSRSSVRDTFMWLANGIGIIDSPYRGEWMATFYKIPFLSKPYKVGDRAAQVIFRKQVSVDLIELKELNKSTRGNGGHGSSGK